MAPSRNARLCATIVICDGGFNAHLAACGMMGSVVRRNWPSRNLSAPDGNREKVTPAGPLCTSIDLLARDLDIARPAFGDVLSVGLSGAYGATASPAGFISHPVVREMIWDGVALGDLLAGHAACIGMVRHPLDVIASNLDLAARMGRFMPELQPWLLRFPAPIAALAEAWADSTEALLAFVTAQGAARLCRFEDLLATPEATLAPLYTLLGVAPQNLAAIHAAVAAPSRPGLGDWKTHAEAGLNPAPVGRWQKAMSRRVASPPPPWCSARMTFWGPNFTPS